MQDRDPPADAETPSASPSVDPFVHDELDPVWRALSNAVRRTILDLLALGPMTTGDLSDSFPGLSRFAVMQHLKVLAEADLLVVVRDGRKRYNYINPVPIQRVYDRWVSRYMQPWASALASLKTEVEARERDTA